MIDLAPAASRVPPAAPAGTARLQLRSLTLQRGARTLVRALELDVHGGERWAVLGPNGAGKSTLLLALTGVVPPQAGAIVCDGRPLGQWSIAELAERRAWVGDRWTDAFAGRVLDAVMAARYRLQVDPDGERVARAALAEMDAAALAERDLRGLSRGERQRVALAAALAQDAPLVLLDEPTAHQDPRHQALVLARLAARTRQTWIAVLHDLNAAARFATHALLLDGEGGWTAGAAADTLLPATLGRLFGVPVEAVVGADGQRHFLTRLG